MQANQFRVPSATSAQPPRKVLGVPLGDFGLFSTLLLSAALGFITFFGVCFVAIVTLLVYNQLGHHTVNYADSYRDAAFPAGCIVLVASFVLLMSVWLKRKFTGR
jgi:hypothetical protein